MRSIKVQANCALIKRLNDDVTIRVEDIKEAPFVYNFTFW